MQNGTAHILRWSGHARTLRWKRKQFIKKTVENNVLTLFEAAFVWWGNHRAMIKYSQVIGLEHIIQANRNNQGVILIGAHYTTLEIAGPLLHLRTPCIATFRKQNNPLLYYLINKARLKNLRGLIEKKEMRRMIKALKNGETVWYATDQDYGRKESVFVPFFNTPAATLGTIGKLTKLTGAKVLLLSHFRVEDAHQVCYELTISNPFTEPFTDNDEDNARRLNQALECAIAQDPTQYMWVHRRFKTRPNPNDPKFY